MKHPGTTSLIPNKDGRTPLHEAVMKGHTNIVEKFFTYDIFRDRENIDEVDHHKRTALHWAALGGYDTILQMLVQNGANVKLSSDDGKTALRVAANADHDTTKWVLLRAWVAQGGDEGVIRELLDDGKVRIDSEDEDSWTLQSCASESGNDAIVRLLVKEGADIEAKDMIGRTPLYCAVGEGHEDVVKLLVEKGADIEAKNYGYGQTPLHWAAKNGHEGVIQLLVKEGADIEVKDINGHTPLYCAVGEGHEDVVKLLVEKGADIEAKDRDGRTPLSIATKKGNERMVKLLHQEI
ncbi:inversin [Trichoderma asperellum]|uniref:Inversin n=1 Tax=Trichoderma asperellum TaxID=101201 RepID=A0A6V8QQ71_TRIAP|nr:inversin [Trichoderma asperellum]